MKTQTISLIAGLGNHVSLKSRHSIGMQICNVTAEKFNSKWIYEKKYKAFLASIQKNGHEFILLKSKWPMNLNGKSIQKIVSDMKICTDNILVVHDDMERRLGKFSWKFNGSANGHNGVKSVIGSLRTDKFRRLRVGIGRPENRAEVISYVLEDFKNTEQTELHRVLQNSAVLIINEVINNHPDGTTEEPI